MRLLFRRIHHGKMGWPDKWRIAIFPFIGNNCLWCPETGNSCGLHRQSPVALDRHLGVPGDPIQHKCIDTHCTFFFHSFDCDVKDLWVC